MFLENSIYNGCDKNRFSSKMYNRMLRPLIVFIIVILFLVKIQFLPNENRLWSKKVLGDNDFTKNDQDYESSEEYLKSKIDFNYSAETIKKQIYDLNKNSVIYNLERFDCITNETVVIAIQVHRRIGYLKHLIVSLARAQDISKTLVIFSHDYFDETINGVIKSIDFCCVLQIFFPYTQQLFVNEFPNDSPYDCPREMKRNGSTQENCINVSWPDRYGHYREARFTQTKHHWWWKCNVIFDVLPATKNYLGFVLFLEEDHYVSKDFLYVLKGMDYARDLLCPGCNILTLGAYVKHITYENTASLLEMGSWIGSKHNMGMAFNRTTWHTIKRCTNEFCTLDEYNWDWTLHHISSNCVKPKLTVLAVKAPRVFHIGDCGFHHKKKKCDASKVLSQVEKALLVGDNYLFPSSLEVSKIPEVTYQKIKNLQLNGGWADHRDHQLCQNITFWPYPYYWNIFNKTYS